MSEKRLFILDAEIKRPDGTIEQLSTEEAQVLVRPDGKSIQLPKDGLSGLSGTYDFTITWIEGEPGQILNMLIGYPCFETESSLEETHDGRSPHA